jgi:toxin FitB
MILLDTNVISELMRPGPELAVLQWLATQPIAELATTTINLAEVRFGLARLPFGKRRRDLETKFRAFAVRGFGSRVFGFDANAADAYGELAADCERAGRRLHGFDGLIAAIAKSRGLIVATRNAGDFTECGVAVINPWNTAGLT